MNKRFNVAIELPIVTESGIPDSAHIALYAKSDGKVYKRTSDGVEEVLGAGGGGDSPVFSGLVSQSSQTHIELSDDLSNKEFSEVRIFYRHGIIVYVATFTVLPNAVTVSKMETIQDNDPENYSCSFNIDSGKLRLTFNASTSQSGSGSLVVRVSNFTKAT